MRSYNFSLVANTPQTVGVVANHFRILEATNDVYISLDDSPFFKVKSGQGLTSADSFRSIKLKTLVNQSVLIVAGNGTFYDANETININTATTIQAANTYKPLVDVVVLAGASAAIVGANASRKLLTITNPVTNTGSFRLGVPLDVGAGKGDRLGVGESISLALTGALSAFNEGVIDESLIISELVSI